MQCVNDALSSDWQGEDDMLFAVLRNPVGNEPLIAFRRIPGVIPVELMYGSDGYNSIDWKATVLLNLAMNARFQLSLRGPWAGKHPLQSRHAPVHIVFL